MKWPWMLSSLAVVGVALIAVPSRASKDCAKEKCNSPEHCVLAKYRAQQAAMAAVFGSKALRAQYPDIASFIQAANQASVNLGKSLPSCAGASGIPPAISVTGDIGAETDENCLMKIKYDTPEKKMGIDDVDGMGNPTTNPNVKNIATCSEIIEGVVKHEKVHQANCNDAKKAHQSYPSDDMGGYLDDDTAAYRTASAYLKGEMDKGPRCSPDEKGRKKARNFMFHQMTTLSPPKAAAPGKGGK